MSNPTVSCIVPVYKVEQFLPQCIDSILAQTFTDFELILVDDGSPDNSGKICDEYAQKDSRIKVIHKENGGVSSARNAGLDAAKGEWICFVDSDDLISPDYMTLMFDAAMSSKANLVLSVMTKNFDNFCEHSNGESRIYSKQELLLELNENRLSDFSVNLLNPPVNKLYHKSIINESRFDISKKYYEDMAFNWNAISKIEILAFVAYNLYYYRDNCQSATNTLSIKRIQDILSAAELNNQYASQYGVNKYSSDLFTLNAVFQCLFFLASCENSFIKNNKTDIKLLLRKMRLLSRKLGLSKLLFKKQMLVVICFQLLGFSFIRMLYHLKRGM